jgi:hypothetical protein
MPRPRTYNSDRPLSPLPNVLGVEVADGEKLPPWEDGALLHDIAPAAEILTKVLGRGFSERKIRKRIKDGTWSQGHHWFMTGGCYKISIARVVEWQTRGEK